MKKIIFVTSSLNTTKTILDTKFPQKITNTYQLLDNLKKYWPKQAKVLMISSDPLTFEINDFYANIYRKSFQLSDLEYQKIEILDDRYYPNLQQYDVLILAGGHTLTQNKFFNQINLKAQLENYSGLMIGISAGSMNLAGLVYGAPELENEAIDKNFQRYYPGLDLFPYRIIPHFNELKDITLDNLKMVEEILIPDSFNHDFYTLDDDSYFILKDNHISLYGSSYYFEKGKTIYLNNQADFMRLIKY